jgi:hypothetical protein
MSLNQGIEFQDIRFTTSELIEQMLQNITTERITLREIISMMGEQGLLLICVFMSLPFLIPVSIPGVSTVFGAGIVLVSVAITINRLPWLPGFIADRPLDSQKLIPVLRKGVALLQRIDRFLKPRWLQLTTGAVMNRFNGLVLMLSGILLMVPLGFVPFSNTLPGLAILFVASGISQRDGFLIAFGYLSVVGTIGYFGGLAYMVYAAGQSIIF